MFPYGLLPFGGELFAKMLETAKRYGYSAEKKDYPALAEVKKEVNFFNRKSTAQLEAEGKRYIAYLTDDGRRPLLDAFRVLSVNSQSPNKEGAWEFLRFLLGPEAQADFRHLCNGGSRTVNEYPVSRKAFAEVAAAEMEEGAITQEVTSAGNVVPCYKTGWQQDIVDLHFDQEAYRELYALTEETVREIEETLEATRHMVTRTDSIREIIFEEAAVYFAGDKTVEEVAKTIQNRVQLYLNEHR